MNYLLFLYFKSLIYADRNEGKKSSLLPSPIGCGVFGALQRSRVMGPHGDCPSGRSWSFNFCTIFVVYICALRSGAVGLRQLYLPDRCNRLLSSRELGAGKWGAVTKINLEGLQICPMLFL